MLTDGSNEKNATLSPVSRRHFVKGATAAAIAPAILASRSAYALGGADLKVGLVGCGGRGTGAAVQALNADPGCVLTAMGDAFSDRLTSSHKNITEAMGAEASQKVRVAPEQQFVGFDAYQQVIDSGVDVVVLATPPHFRPEHIEAAVKAKKHIFTEKPMAVDAPGARRVVEAAKKAKQQGTSLVSGFCWRYHYPQREAYNRILDGAIGDVRAMYTTYNAGAWVAPVKRKAGWSDMEAQMRSWHYFTWLSGDHIVEQACHAIDWMNWAFGGVMPVKCHAVGGRQVRPDLPETGHAYDHFSVVYEYENGARGYHMCRHYPGCPSDNSAYLLGTEGTCTNTPWTPNQIRIERTDGKNWRYEGRPNSMYQTEHDELFASIRDNKPMNDGEWMMNSTMLGIMGRMAAYTGQTITWEQAWNSEQNLSPKQYAWGEMPTPEVAVPGKTKFV